MKMTKHFTKKSTFKKKVKQFKINKMKTHRRMYFEKWKQYDIFLIISTFFNNILKPHFTAKVLSSRNTFIPLAALVISESNLPDPVHCILLA